MTQGSIVDTTVKLEPSKKLIKHLRTIGGKDIPANLRKITQKKGANAEKVENVFEFSECSQEILSKKDVDRIAYYESTVSERLSLELPPEKPDAPPKKSSGNRLNVSDLHWLYERLKEARQAGESEVYLNDLLEGCELLLPENEEIPRDPKLEERCQQLRDKQDELHYRAMTQNVDVAKVRHPTDSVAYQIKMINNQLLAVAQFVISVLAGFVFGFIGIQLMVGELNFGIRLLLGIGSALIIAIAELYFLTKKLHYEDVVVDAPPSPRHAHQD